MNTVNLSTGGPPETVLPSPPDELTSALQKAMTVDGDRQRQRDAVSSVVAAAPLFLEAWARLGDLARDPVEAYAAYRVGYHRGLDQLRQNGRMAEVIGEQAEAERCAQFLAQLDPAWDPAQVDRPTE